jgi:hypothetical protein
MSIPSIYTPQFNTSSYEQVAPFLRTCGRSTPYGRTIHHTSNDYISRLKSVRAIRKYRSDGLSTLVGRSETWQFKEPSSAHCAFTKADGPSIKVEQSMTWELVLSELKPRTVCNTTHQKHTVPAQIEFGTYRWSTNTGQTARTITQGLVQFDKLSGQDRGRSDPKA